MGAAPGLRKRGALSSWDRGEGGWPGAEHLLGMKGGTGRLGIGPGGLWRNTGLALSSPSLRLHSARRLCLSQLCAEG